MQRERVVSADSHLLIKDETLLAHMASGHRAQVAQLIEARKALPVRQDTGLYEGAKWPAFGRKGEWDPVERLKDMDTDGVDVEVLYTLANAGQHYYALKDGGRLATFEAFNDAAMTFAKPNPKRLLPVYLLPVADVEEAVSETKRLAKAGARALMVPLFPADIGLKPYFDRSWDPLWAAVQDAGIPVSQHLSGHAHSERMRFYDQSPRKGLYRSMSPMWMSESVACWAMSGVLERFPRLRIILVEAGLGWLPYFLERMDVTAQRIKWDTSVLPQKPSFYWRRNMATTFEEEPFGVRFIHEIGIDNLMWGSDYPHPDSTWPDSMKVLDRLFKDLPAPDKRRLTCENASRAYGLN